MMILNRITNWVYFITGMGFIVTLGVTKSQDSSAVRTPADTNLRTTISVKPEQQKRVEAQKDTIDKLFEKVTAPVEFPEKTVKKAQVAVNNLIAADKVLSQAINVLVPITTRYHFHELEITPALPIEVDSLASPKVEVPEFERPGFLKRLFRKNK